MEGARGRRSWKRQVAEGVAIPADVAASRYTGLPGSVAWGAKVAMERIEEQLQAGEDRRIEAARDQDVREEQEARRKEQEAIRREQEAILQARWERFKTLATAGTLAAAWAFLSHVERTMRK